MPSAIGAAAATFGSGVTAASSVALAWGGAGGGKAAGIGGSIATVGPGGAATGRASGCGARSMAAHPATDRTLRLAANSATGIAGPMPRAQAAAPANAGGAGEDIGAHRFVFMAGGREYNTKRHKRAVDMILYRLFRCP